VFDMKRKAITLSADEDIDCAIRDLLVGVGVETASSTGAAVSHFYRLSPRSGSVHIDNLSVIWKTRVSRGLLASDDPAPVDMAASHAVTVTEVTT
jgi:hypothetical protein